MTEPSGASTEQPGPRPPRRPWWRFGLRILMAGVAVAGLLLAGVYNRIRFEQVVAVELRNGTDSELRDVSVSSGGGTVRADRLLQGETLAGRLWPTEGVRSAKGAFKCDFEIRATLKNGKTLVMSRDLPAFNLYAYEPHVRWFITQYGTADGKTWYGSGYEGMEERPVPDYVKTLRSWLLR